MRHIAAILIALLAVDWPGRDFISRFPNHAQNESATRLMATASRLADGRHNDADTLRTLRAQIISSPPPVWGQQIDEILEPPVPPLSLHMRLFRMFGADAMAQHNNAAAWADVHAIWILSRALWDRPEAWSIATAAFGNRTIARAAARLEGPQPAWLAEAAAFEVRAPLVRSIEYEAWLTRERADRYPAGESDGSLLDDTVREAAAPLMRPIRLVKADLEVQRLQALASNPCANVSSAPEWSAFARRVMASRLKNDGVAQCR
ncbi:MAG TPA: hypothetical protein VER58_20555 [Thermoanaerobaculia bacterium]|nr:hypothetical protein [Thermoanaerobaculia bacterium]